MRRLSSISRVFLVPFVLAICLGILQGSVYSEPLVFSDVPPEHPYHDYIVALYQHGYVVSCNETTNMYCPDEPVTRAQQAVFVMRGVFGTDFEPPQPTEQIFHDVDISTHWGADWIDAMYREGLTAGCSTEQLAYCPTRLNTIAEGCTFMLKIMFGENYIPPVATGIFDDVQSGVWYEPWVEACYMEEILQPCQTEPGVYACPEDILKRDMAAYMLAQAKGLTILDPAPTYTITSQQGHSTQSTSTRSPSGVSEDSCDSNTIIATLTNEKNNIKHFEVLFEGCFAPLYLDLVWTSSGWETNLVKLYEVGAPLLDTGYYTADDYQIQILTDEFDHLTGLVFEQLRPVDVSYHTMAYGFVTIVEEMTFELGLSHE
jgi:hypothetical protein